MKFKKINSNLSFKMKVIFALSPIITLPILISCGANPQELDKQGLNIKSPKQSDNSNSSSVDISSLKEQIQDLNSLDEVSKSLFKKLNSLSLNDETKAKREKELQRTIDLIRKQIQTDGIESEQTKMVINSLDEIFKPQEKEHKPIEFTPEPPVSDERVKKFEKELADARPKGQTVPEFDASGKRIVGDQYEYDFPKKELDYVLAYFNLGGSQSATYAWKPSKVFGLWDGPNAPKYSSELEELARKVDQPLPENAYYRTFVTPDPTDRNLIHIPTTKRSFPIPPISFYKSGPKKGQIDKDKSGPLHFGLPRDIVNNDYMELIDNAVSVSIGDGVIGTKLVKNADGTEHYAEDYRKPGEERGNTEAKRGTMNIIDYKLPNDGSYPLTWYFITNTHVLAQLRLENDKGDGVYGRDTTNYNTYNKAYNTTDINISKLIKEQVKLNQEIPLVGTGEWEKYYKQIKIDPKNVKLVMIGSQIMKQKLSELTHQDFWKGVNFLMDVGIIEITFKDEAEAKSVTENWYKKHKDTNKDGKYVLTSDVNLLDKTQYSELKENPFYAFGFPTSAFEKMIPQLNYKIPVNNGRSFDKPAIENLLDGSISPLINKPSKLFPKARASQKYLKELEPLKKGGGDLNWSRSFRSFMSTPGLMDIFIAAPYLDGGGQILEKYDDATHTFNKDDLYVFSGLGTTLDNMSGHGGMSGSAVYLKDKDNRKKMYGLVYMSGPNASVAGVLNLRSYGKNYEGYYGKYNLPKYDLIYGDGTANGAGEQRKSYFDAMQHMYKGQQIKTFLFPNGFDESYRKDVFKNNGQ